MAGYGLNPFPKQALVFMSLQYKSFEITVGKGEIAWTEQFLLVTFPTVFSTRLENFLPFSSNLKLSSANSFSLEACQFCHLVVWERVNKVLSIFM